MNSRERARERVNTLPNAVWDCEACGGNSTMQLRRSSLNTQFKADDVGLKCGECRFYRTHGIPFEDADEFDREREARDGRVLDFTRRDGEPDKERLAALGYIAASDTQ